MGCRKDTQDLIDKLEKDRKQVRGIFATPEERLTAAKRLAESEKIPLAEAEARISERVKGQATIEQQRLRTESDKTLREVHDAIKDDMTSAETDVAFGKLKTNVAAEQATGSGASESGRLLQSEAGGIKAQQRATEATVARIEAEPNRKAEFLRKYKQIDPTDTKALENFAKSLENPSWSDLLYEYWYNGILSGFSSTHLVNIQSTGLFTAWQIPHTFVRAAAEIPLAALQGRTTPPSWLLPHPPCAPRRLSHH